MTFESDCTRVNYPLDPCQGPRYIEPTSDILEHDVLDQIYHMIVGKRVDYINP